MTPVRLIDATPVADDWRLIRLEWHGAAPSPGQWLWLDAGGDRHCLPVRDADPQEGWLAGIVPGALSPDRLGPGVIANVSTIQGEAIQVSGDGPLIILGEDLGIGPALAFAERHAERTRLALLGGQYGVPATLVPSRFYVPALADGAIAGIAPLESQGVAARVALGRDDRPGVYEGSVFELLGRYLSETPAEFRQSLQIIACGPWSALGQRRADLAASVGQLQVVELPSAVRDSTP